VAAICPLRGFACKRVKYSVNINQQALAHTTLDMNDAAILDYLYVYCNSRSEKIEAQRLRDADGIWTWVDYGTLIDEMPLLRIKSAAAITPRIQHIEREGYISTKRVGHQKLFVKLNSLVDELFIKPNSSIHQTKQSYSVSRTNHNTIDPNTKINKALPEGNADRARKAVKATQEYFTTSYEQKFGSQPAINFGKDYTVIRSTLGLFKTFDEVKALIDAFLASEKGLQHGHTLAICFSANTINLWKAGQLTPPLQAIFTTKKS
jgi:hypothetical protein